MNFVDYLDYPHNEVAAIYKGINKLMEKGLDEKRYEIFVSSESKMAKLIKNKEISLTQIFGVDVKTSPFMLKEYVVFVLKEPWKYLRPDEERQLTCKVCDEKGVDK